MTGIWILIAGCVISLFIIMIATQKRPEQFILYDILSLIVAMVFAFIAIFPWVLSNNRFSYDVNIFLLVICAYCLIQVMYFVAVIDKIPEIREQLRKRAGRATLAALLIVIDVFINILVIR